jgi:osmotically-inducible protein OsmY
MGGGMSIEMWRADDDEVGVRSELQKRVFDELAREPAVNQAALHVDVRGRCVVISGVASSYVERLAAERAARRVPGVREVRNEVAVMLPPSRQRSDADLVNAARYLIESDVLIPQDSVAVAVASGWATLTGVVRRHDEREAAEDVLERLVGIRGITNLVTVAPAGSPGAAAPSIEEMLARHPALHGDRLRVQVRGNAVVLRGRVRSLAERDTAVAAVWEVPGVASVRDQLQVGRKGPR